MLRHFAPVVCAVVAAELKQNRRVFKRCALCEHFFHAVKTDIDCRAHVAAACQLYAAFRHARFERASVKLIFSADAVLKVHDALEHGVSENHYAVVVHI